MIIIKLMGGHSNQLFQYAAARRLAIKHNTNLIIDTERLNQRVLGETPRELEIDGYHLDAQIDPDIPNLVYSTNNRLQNIIHRILSRDRYIRRVGQHSMEFEPSILNLGNNVILEGDFQDERYFLDIRPQLLKDLTYKKAPNKQNASMLKKISAAESVSIHVRRGDYISNPSAKKFYVQLDQEYYNRAINRINKLVTNPEFFVISNDIMWCKKNLKIASKVAFVDINTSGADDMRLMRACKHNIMANSSFSWWGAWLNENPQKIVITPKQWFAQKEWRNIDRCPKDWIRL